jgi:hypothetical protein
MKWRWLPIAAWLLFGAGTAIAAERIETIPTRPGVTQGLYLVTPERAPWATAILYVGGEGRIHLGPDGPSEESDNFLMRIRDQLTGAGLMLVYPDTPSDKSPGYGNFRSDPRHATDAQAILNWLHSQNDGPVFIIGTSRGTISAAYIASHLEPNAIAGVALTSSVTRTTRSAGAIDSTMLAGIHIPALVMANKDDRCFVTPPDDVPFLLNGLKNSPHKDSSLLGGGSTPKSGPCEGLAGHGYYGIEDQAAKVLIDWMKGIAGD